MKRKVFAWILSLCMTFGLSACGFSQGDSPFDSTAGDSLRDETVDTGSQDGSENTPEDTYSDDSNMESNDGSGDGSGNDGAQLPDDDGIMQILLVERIDGEADAFAQLFEENVEKSVYEISRVCVTDANFPATVEELFAYDEIILNNIANADMPDGFADILHSYVSDFGGGLFTVGGDDENGQQHSYKPEDLFGTRYGELLPIQPQKYTPPLGVMMIIDRSGSMDMTSDMGETRLEIAKKGAAACLDSLTGRDYCGIMTMQEIESVEIELTPATQRARLLEALYNIDGCGGGTIFGDALRRAGQALLALRDVVNRHVIVFTDGLPADSYEEYAPALDSFAKMGITFSFVAVSENLTEPEKSVLMDAAALGGGRCYFAEDGDGVMQAAREELSVPDLRNEEDSGFTVAVEMPDSAVFEGVEIPLEMRLEGFYPARAKDGAEVLLSGRYHYPIYAQWQVGNGKVGSFLCDLGGLRSIDFVNSVEGKQIVRNIVAALAR